MEGSFDGGAIIERRELPPQRPVTVEANSYKTRGEPTAITIEGVTSQWHSLKGGKKDGETNTVQEAYEIFYNPELNSWLKTVPPGTEFARWENRLKKSVPIAKAACAVADLPELAEQIKEHELSIRGQRAYGFTSPHIGQSIEHYIKQEHSQDNPEEVLTFINTTYDLAFLQAKRLYENYGYWADDPNPGNILLHAKDDKLHIVLIDFSNKVQIKQLDTKEIPDHIAPPGQKEAVLAQRHARNIEQLRMKFEKQCRIAGGKVLQAGEQTQAPKPVVIQD